MQYALVNNIRLEAFAGGKGICAMCGADMIAKCGNRIIHHWAHAHKQNCDPWWENETQWHRNWKNFFPEEWREVTHLAPSGEIHRADVKTSNGIIIEFQHSAISNSERIAREEFYGNLIWVIDGKPFKGNFDIFHLLPNPDSELAQDLVWKKASRQAKGAANGIFWRLSENPDNNDFVQIHGFNKIKKEIEESYCGHHQYDWIRPHKTWQEATCPVYIDFGEESLVRLEEYDKSKLPCIRFISKKLFLDDICRESSALNVAASRYFLELK